MVRSPARMLSLLSPSPPQNTRFTPFLPTLSPQFYLNLALAPCPSKRFVTFGAAPRSSDGPFFPPVGAFQVGPWSHLTPTPTPTASAPREQDPASRNLSGDLRRRCEGRPSLLLDQQAARESQGPGPRHCRKLPAPPSRPAGGARVRVGQRPREVRQPRPRHPLRRQEAGGRLPVPTGWAVAAPRGPAPRRASSPEGYGPPTRIKMVERSGVERQATARGHHPSSPAFRRSSARYGQRRNGEERLLLPTLLFEKSGWLLKEPLISQGPPSRH